MLRESSEILWSFLLISKFTDFYHKKKKKKKKEKGKFTHAPRVLWTYELILHPFFLWGKELLFEL